MEWNLWSLEKVTSANSGARQRSTMGKIKQDVFVL